MPIRFLKTPSEIADVSLESPLPVMEASKERTLVQADRLLISERNATTDADRDLADSTAPEQPTLSNCAQYHTLIWTMFKTGAADINYTVLARNTDFSGAPLGTGWRQIATGTISGAANTWYRIVITEPNGLYYDQYRIRLQASTSTGQRSVILGVKR